jgi:hypothetical protein
MQWGILEVLVALSGAITAVGFLIVPEASVRARLTGMGVGVLFVGYGIYAANQTSGIVLIPAGALAVALVVLFMLYHAFRDQQQRRFIPPLPPGTPGARQCLSCGLAFVVEHSGPCPSCRGTLAPPVSTQGKE